MCRKNGGKNVNRLSQIEQEMKEAKKEAQEFLKLAEQHRENGEAKGYQVALMMYELNQKRYRDLEDFYTKIAVMSGNSITA
jgi:hypothetical protein